MMASFDSWMERVRSGSSSVDKDVDGLPPLHAACLMSRADVVDWLLKEKNANLISSDRVGRMPLHAAVEGGSADVLALLVERMRARNWVPKMAGMRDDRGLTAMHLAAKKPTAELFLALTEEMTADLLRRPDFLQKGDTAGLLLTAVLSDNVGVVRWMVNEKLLEEVNVAGKAGRTPLQAAAMEGREAIAQLLIEGGADLDAVDDGGRTAAAWAFMLGHDQLGTALVAAGASTTVVDESGKSVADWRDGTAGAEEADDGEYYGDGDDDDHAYKHEHVHDDVEEIAADEPSAAPSSSAAASSAASVPAVRRSWLEEEAAMAASASAYFHDDDEDDAAVYDEFGFDRDFDDERQARDAAAASVGGAGMAAMSSGAAAMSYDDDIARLRAEMAADRDDLEAAASASLIWASGDEEAQLRAALEESRRMAGLPPVEVDEAEAAWARAETEGTDGGVTRGGIAIVRLPEAEAGTRPAGDYGDDTAMRPHGDLSFLSHADGGSGESKMAHSPSHAMPPVLAAGEDDEAERVWARADAEGIDGGVTRGGVSIVRLPEAVAGTRASFAAEETDARFVPVLAAGEDDEAERVWARAATEGVDGGVSRGGVSIVRLPEAVAGTYGSEEVVGVDDVSLIDVDGGWQEGKSGE